MSSPKGSSRTDDERYWKPEVDKSGTGSAVIRFLPAKAEEGFPFVQLHTHGFQGPTGKWLIDNCPTSIEKDCPVCKANTDLWQTGSEANKKLASSRKRKLNYISNVLVVNDPKHPENNGKVFLYKYGKKIFEKIKDQISPPEEFPDMAPVDPYSMEEGANFKLRVVRVDGFPNYDKSGFDNPTPVGNDDRIAELETQLFSLNDILDPKHFKSYDEMNKRFIATTGGPATPNTDETEVEDGDDKPPFDAEDDLPIAKPKSARTTTPKPVGKTAAAPSATSTASSPDEDEDYFAKLTANQQS
jgi:hypothetical protein